MEVSLKIVSFMYKNHRGEIAKRTITPDAVEFILDPGYNYQPGWFISGWDHDKNARRSFALCNIVLEDLMKLRNTHSTIFRIELYPEIKQ